MGLEIVFASPSVEKQLGNWQIEVVGQLADDHVFLDGHTDKDGVTDESATGAA